MMVVDASAALSLVLPSQATAASNNFFRTEVSPRIAPAIFAFEVRNALLRLERRRALSSEQANEASATLASLVDLRPWDVSPADFVRLFALARQEGLSLFDAAYLDLALREAAALVSRDGALLEAAERRRIRVQDLR